MASIERFSTVQSRASRRPSNRWLARNRGRVSRFIKSWISVRGASKRPTSIVSVFAASRVAFWHSDGLGNARTTGGGVRKPSRIRSATDQRGATARSNSWWRTG